MDTLADFTLPKQICREGASKGKGTRKNTLKSWKTSVKEPNFSKLRLISFYIFL